jgi:hypothetical protein
VADAVSLAHDLREEVQRLRDTQKIPTQIRLSQDAYNTLRHELSFGPFGPKHSVLFDGLPCVIAFGLEGPFRVRFVQARS